VISKALAARVPRARYLVGLDAQAFAVAEALTPTAIKDLLVRKTMGL
jgi:hypothetical protein